MNFRRLALALGALSFASCFEVASKTCATGLVCPIGSVCSGDSSTCIASTALCGNGRPDPIADGGMEYCDDGNITNGDGCRSDCLGKGECGDGTDDPGTEQCDDGNRTVGDGCNLECKREFCGNAVIDALRDGGAEPCDDGNTIQGDGCRSNCTRELCGDGLRDPLPDGGVEPCEDGNLINGDDCSSTCVQEKCLNGVVDVLHDGGMEECDNDTAACGLTCLIVRCGNGQKDNATSGRGQGNEVCDDGNLDGGDGCNSRCLGEENCGDGFLDPRLKDGGFEICDDNNLIGGDGCSADCRSNETCGNTITDATRGELCDDGDLVSGDGCRQDCKGLEACGDGFRDAVLNDGGTEQCDDGNLDAGDGCSPSCRDEVCGNGITDSARGELCDDNNLASGDGCRQDCKGLEVCGDNFRDAVLRDGGTEQCDDGNLAVGDGCSTSCRFEVCGNGIRDPNELCDDGNTNPIGPTDNCSSDCRSTGTCGNGTVETGLSEQCDNGVANANTAACTATCQIARCGDTFTRTGVEQCDTGAESLTCNVNCTDRRCGDGIINATASEQCDVFGAVTATETATCDTDCTVAFCGDSKVNLVLLEQCDTGGNTTSCNSNCRPALCGDSFLNTSHGLGTDGGAPFEQCDTGGNSNFCDSDCSPAVCGDGLFNSVAGEQCDDGNPSNIDDCVAGCRSNTCGDGFRDQQGPSTEACDDGNTSSETFCAYGLQNCTGCAFNCGTVLNLTGPYCGDNSTNGPEACDQGINNGVTSCAYGTATCTICNANCTAFIPRTGERCGDNLTNGSGANAEICDDGNTTTETFCPYGTANCTLCRDDCRANLPLTGATCGDGLTNGPEACDQGSAINGGTSCPYGTASCSICNANCTASIPRTGERCGDGVMNGTGPDLEACDDGNTSLETSCPYGQPTCTRCDATCDTVLLLTGPFCGDRLTNGAEQCDDGNALACGTCSATCTSAQPPVEASGSIRTVDKNSLVEGETVTIADGTHPAVVLVIQKTAGYDAGTRWPVDLTLASGSSTTEVATAFIAAINSLDAGTLTITATPGSSQPRVRLRHDSIGSIGNQPILEDVGNNTFAVTGMIGGGGGDCVVGIGCVTADDCASGNCAAPTDGGTMNTCQ